MWWLPQRIRPAMDAGTAVAVLGALTSATLAGCGSGDSTVAKTPSAPGPKATSSVSETPGTPSNAAAPPPTSAPPSDPCAVNLVAPQIAKAVAELPPDTRSQQPWNPEPLAGNYSACADLSAVIVKANTNAEHPSTRAVLFHRGEYVPQSAPDTYGFNAIDLARCSPDTVALQHASGIPGVNGLVRFHWNGTGVEIIPNTAR